LREEGGAVEVASCSIYNHFIISSDPKVVEATSTLEVTIIMVTAMEEEKEDKST